MYTKLTREIRDSIGNSQLPAEFLIDLAAEFGEAIEAVNNRLEGISKILSDGYRDEAIDLAEQAPPVLDLVGQLDFPERDQWDLVMDDSLMERSPALMLGAAEQLESAYEERAAIEPLLKKHRLLALAQAPLESRIFILRKLCQKDPTNPIWIDDSQMLQKARLSQINTEYRIAKSKKNVDKLLSLTKELAQPWDVPIPKQLKLEVDGSSEDLARRSARKQLDDIAHRLNDCLIEYDESTARELRSRWHEINKIAKLTPNDSVFQLATEPLSWLAEADEESDQDKKFHAAVARLEQGVDLQKPIDRLDKLIYEAQKFERELPETLVHRVNTYRDGLESGGRRKTWLIIAVSLAVLIISIIAISSFITYQAKQNTIADARQQMQKLIDDDAYKSGEQYFNGLAEFLRNDGEVIRLNNQLLANRDKENARIDKLAELMELVDLTGPLELNLDDYLDEAEQVAATDSERNQIKTLENRLLSERQLRQNTRNNAFKEKLEPSQEKIRLLVNGDIEADSIGKLQILIGEIEELVFDSTERVDGKAGISNLAEKNAVKLIETAKNQVREIEIESKSIASLFRLKDKLEIPRQFSDALTDYAKKYPDNINSVDFDKTATELASWIGFKNWQELARSLDSEDLNALTTDQAKVLVQKLSSAKTTNLGISDLVIKKLDDFLTEKTSKPLAANFDKAIFKQELSNFEFQKIQIAIWNDEVFYLANDPDPEKDDTFKFFIQNGKTQEKGSVKGKFKTLNAPHCNLASQLIELVKGSTEDSDNEQLVIQLLTAVLAENMDTKLRKYLDPLVQCKYIEEILYTLVPMSDELRNFKSEQLDIFDADKFDLSDWKQYTDTKTKNDTNREAARRFLNSFKNSLEKLKVTTKEVTVNKDEFIKIEDLAKYKLIGFIYKTKNKWRLDPLVEFKDQAPLFCLKPSPDGTVKMASIGLLEKSNEELKDNQALQAGRPVYAYTGKK